ncbi:hypothetical protein HY416_01815 [Candidatus Kaiserbacteria bacterium]|nr:hypothetical protein [Candidatus Kaiserbacteria bacterium]
MKKYLLLISVVVLLSPLFFAASAHAGRADYPGAPWEKDCDVVPTNWITSLRNPEDVNSNVSYDPDLGRVIVVQEGSAPFNFIYSYHINASNPGWFELTPVTNGPRLSASETTPARSITAHGGHSAAFGHNMGSLDNQPWIWDRNDYSFRVNVDIAGVAPGYYTVGYDTRVGDECYSDRLSNPGRFGLGGTIQFPRVTIAVMANNPQQPPPNNQPPVVDAGPDKTVTEGQQVAINDATASDPDGSITSYKWTCTGGALSPDNTLDVAYTAPNGSNVYPTYSCTLTVTDNSGATASDSLDITVNDVPPPPLAVTCQASAPSVQTNQSVTWGASPSGGSGFYQYSWADTDGATFSSGEAHSWTRTYTTAGSRNASVIVADTLGNTKTASCGSVTVTAPTAVMRTLQVNKGGTGSGTVTGQGISCGSDCNESYSDGTPVTLHASPAIGSVFSHWSGPTSGCDGSTVPDCQTTMNQDRTVGATFQPEGVPIPTVNGQCNSEPDTHWACRTGTSANQTGGSTGPWTWSCNGSGPNHTDASCSEPAPPAGAPICTLSANPSTISSGNSTTLSWTVSANATSFVISGIGNVHNGTTSGSRSVSPTANTTYTGTVSTGSQTGTCSTSVTVTPTGPTVVGACSNPPSHYQCSAGTPANQNETNTKWTWNCAGTPGGGSGTNAVCTEWKPGVILGACSATHYGCEGGSVSLNNIEGSTEWTWVCSGSGGAETHASCSEPKPPTVVLTAVPACLMQGELVDVTWNVTSGTPGSGDGINMYKSTGTGDVYVTEDSTGGTDTGTLSFNTVDVSPGMYFFRYVFRFNGGGSFGGQSNSVMVVAQGESCGPVNGACRPEPDTHYECAPGSTSANNVVSSTGWTWTCNGSNGGTSASCSEPIGPPVVNGKCNATHYQCDAGTSVNNIGGASGPWSWNCVGSNGGTTASCSEPTSPPPDDDDDSDAPTADLDIRRFGDSVWEEDAVTIQSGQHVELRWASDGVNCFGDADFSTGGGNPPNGETQGPNGVRNEPASGSKAYTVRCEDNDGTSRTAQATVTVTGGPGGDPTIDASPLVVDYGGTSNVSWNRNGNTGCSVTGTNGDTLGGNPKTADSAGTPTISLVGETKYTIDCTDVGGDDRSAEVTIRVRPKFEEI